MVKTYKGFKYKGERRRKADVDFVRPRPPKVDENLTGFVRGLPASDLEERVARSLNRYRIPFEFQVEIPTAHSLPFQDRKLDFLVRGRYALEPDGYIGHYHNIGQRAKDFTRDLFLNEALQLLGIEKVIHIKYDKLETQEMTDRTIRELRL